MNSTHTTRIIEVWRNLPCVQIEREGGTLSIQLVINNQRQALVCPVEVAEQLRVLLADATAISSTGVVELARQGQEERNRE